MSAAQAENGGLRTPTGAVIGVKPPKLALQSKSLSIGSNADTGRGQLSSRPFDGSVSARLRTVTVDISKFTKLVSPFAQSLTGTLHRQQIRLRAIIRNVQHEWWMLCRSEEGGTPGVPRDTFDTVIVAWFRCLLPHLSEAIWAEMANDWWRQATSGSEHDIPAINPDSDGTKKEVTTSTEKMGPKSRYAFASGIEALARQLYGIAHEQYSHAATGISKDMESCLARSRYIIKPGEALQQIDSGEGADRRLTKREWFNVLFGLADLFTECAQPQEYYEFLTFFITLYKSGTMHNSADSCRRILVEYARLRGLQVEDLRPLASATVQPFDARISIPNAKGDTSPNIAGSAEKVPKVASIAVAIFAWQGFDRDDPLATQQLSKCIGGEAARLTGSILEEEISPRSRNLFSGGWPESPTAEGSPAIADDTLPGLEGTFAPPKSRFTVHVPHGFAIGSGAVVSNIAEAAVVPMMRQARSAVSRSHTSLEQDLQQTNLVCSKTMNMMNANANATAGGVALDLAPGRWTEKQFGYFVNEDMLRKLLVLRKAVELRLVRERMKQVVIEQKRMGRRRSSAMNSKIGLAHNRRGSASSRASGDSELDYSPRLTVDPAAKQLSRLVSVISTLEDRPPSPVGLRQAAHPDTQQTIGWQDAQSVRNWELLGVRPVWLGATARSSIVTGVGEHATSGGGTLVASVADAKVSTADKWKPRQILPHYSEYGQYYVSSCHGDGDDRGSPQSEQNYFVGVPAAFAFKADVQHRPYANVDEPRIQSTSKFPPNIQHQHANSTGGQARPFQDTTTRSHVLPRHRVAAAPIFVGSCAEGWRWEAYVAVNRTGGIVNTIPPLPSDLYSCVRLNTYSPLPPCADTTGPLFEYLSDESCTIQRFVDSFAEPPVVQPKEFAGAHSDAEDAEQKAAYVTTSSRGYRLVSLGLFPDQTSAARAFDEAMRQAHGKSAVCNFSLSGELVIRVSAGSNKALSLQRPGIVWKKKHLPTVGPMWDDATVLALDPTRYMPPHIAAPRIFWPASLRKAYQDALGAVSLCLHQSGWIAIDPLCTNITGNASLASLLNARYSALSKIIAARAASAINLQTEDLLSMLVGPPVFEPSNDAPAPDLSDGASKSMLGSSVSMASSAVPSGSVALFEDVSRCSTTSPRSASQKISHAVDIGTLPKSIVPAISVARQRLQEHTSSGEAAYPWMTYGDSRTPNKDLWVLSPGWVEENTRLQALESCLAHHLLSVADENPWLGVPARARSLHASNAAALAAGDLLHFSDVSFQMLLESIPDDAFLHLESLLSHRQPTSAATVSTDATHAAGSWNSPRTPFTLRTPADFRGLATKFAVAGKQLGSSNDALGRRHATTRMQDDPRFRIVFGPDQDVMEESRALKVIADNVKRILQGEGQTVAMAPLLSADVFEESLIPSDSEDDGEATLEQQYIDTLAAETNDMETADNRKTASTAPAQKSKKRKKQGAKSKFDKNVDAVAAALQTAALLMAQPREARSTNSSKRDGAEMSGSAGSSAHMQLLAVIEAARKKAAAAKRAKPIAHRPLLDAHAKKRLLKSSSSRKLHDGTIDVEPSGALGEANDLGTALPAQHTTVTRLAKTQKLGRRKGARRHSVADEHDVMIMRHTLLNAMDADLEHVGVEELLSRPLPQDVLSLLEVSDGSAAEEEDEASDEDSVHSEVDVRFAVGAYRPLHENTGPKLQHPMPAERGNSSNEQHLPTCTAADPAERTPTVIADTVPNESEARTQYLQGEEVTVQCSRSGSVSPQPEALGQLPISRPNSGHPVPETITRLRNVVNGASVVDNSDVADRLDIVFNLEGPDHAIFVTAEALPAAYNGSYGHASKASEIASPNQYQKANECSEKAASSNKVAEKPIGAKPDTPKKSGIVGSTNVSRNSRSKTTPQGIAQHSRATSPKAMLVGDDAIRETLALLAPKEAKRYLRAAARGVARRAEADRLAQHAVDCTNMPPDINLRAMATAPIRPAPHHIDLHHAVRGHGNIVLNVMFPESVLRVETHASPDDVHGMQHQGGVRTHSIIAASPRAVVRFDDPVSVNIHMVEPVGESHRGKARFEPLQPRNAASTSKGTTANAPSVTLAIVSTTATVAAPAPARGQEKMQPLPAAPVECYAQPRGRDPYAKRLAAGTSASGHVPTEDAYMDAYGESNQARAVQSSASSVPEAWRVDASPTIAFPQAAFYGEPARPQSNLLQPDLLRAPLSPGMDPAVEHGAKQSRSTSRPAANPGRSSVSTHLDRPSTSYHREALQRASMIEDEYTLENPEVLANRYAGLSKGEIKKMLRAYRRRARRAKTSLAVRRSTNVAPRVDDWSWLRKWRRMSLPDNPRSEYSPTAHAEAPSPGRAFEHEHRLLAEEVPLALVEIPAMSALGRPNVPQHAADANDNLVENRKASLSTLPICEHHPCGSTRASVARNSVVSLLSPDAASKASRSGQAGLSIAGTATGAPVAPTHSAPPRRPFPTRGRRYTAKTSPMRSLAAVFSDAHTASMMDKTPPKTISRTDSQFISMVQALQMPFAAELLEREIRQRDNVAALQSALTAQQRDKLTVMYGSSVAEALMQNKTRARVGSVLDHPDQEELHAHAEEVHLHAEDSAAVPHPPTWTRHATEDINPRLRRLLRERSCSEGLEDAAPELAPSKDARSAAGYLTNLLSNMQAQPTGTIKRRKQGKRDKKMHPRPKCHAGTSSVAVAESAGSASGSPYRRSLLSETGHAVVSSHNADAPQQAKGMSKLEFAVQSADQQRALIERCLRPDLTVSGPASPLLIIK